MKEITGLKRSDISYWKIDRLSTLLQVDHDHQPQLLQLFEQAGIPEIMSLKDCDLDIDALQNANMDGFLDYLKQSEVELPKLPEPVIEEEKIKVKSLREYWKKNKLLLVFSTLVAVLVFPFVYSSRKLKLAFAKIPKAKR